jgi:ribosomal protein S18 acetylase RimI-like enzyme
MSFLLYSPHGDQVLVGIRALVNDVPAAVEAFTGYAAEREIDLSRQVIAATGDGTILAVALWVMSPGRTAMLFVNSLTSLVAARQCVERAGAQAFAAGAELVQALVDPNDAAGQAMYAEAGLTALATLASMERRTPGRSAAPPLPAGVSASNYDESMPALFRAAIEKSYIDTLDCPTLSGMRSIDNVLTGHQSNGLGGAFDPSLWTVLHADGAALGCLILAWTADGRSLEIAYVGLAPEARRRGLGRYLVLLAMHEAAQRGAGMISLAVDARNVPAVALYRRLGFIKVQERVAMVKARKMINFQ